MKKEITMIVIMILLICLTAVLRIKKFSAVEVKPEVATTITQEFSEDE